MKMDQLTEDYLPIAILLAVATVLAVLMVARATFSPITS
jgi:NADH:ubiquinone oxidoreductase subunit 3 (subunit A)